MVLTYLFLASYVATLRVRFNMASSGFGRVRPAWAYMDIADLLLSFVRTHISKAMFEEAEHGGTRPLGGSGLA